MVDGPPQQGDHDTAKAQERRRLVWRLAVVAAGVLVLLALLVVVVPPRFTANRTFDKAADELKAQNDVRTTLLQGFGALLVLTGAAIGASVAYRGVQETRSQIEQAAVDNQEQFRLTRQGQITDRYTKAVEQLGHEKAPSGWAPCTPLSTSPRTTPTTARLSSMSSAPTYACPTPPSPKHGGCRRCRSEGAFRRGWDPTCAT
jgi:hypothetical protein